MPLMVEVLGQLQGTCSHRHARGKAKRAKHHDTHGLEHILHGARRRKTSHGTLPHIECTG